MKGVQKSRRLTKGNWELLETTVVGGQEKVAGDCRRDCDREATVWGAVCRQNCALLV